ncbi:MAG: glycosyltransferase family 4 protein [Bacteroidales bacterium]|nr:glycosyltransferase family 4 protein [Bacteroidales bacterium]
MEARVAMGFDDQAVLIGHIGRLAQDKNPLAIAHAVRKLRGRHWAIYCGEGRDARNTIQRAMELVGDRVRVLPYRRQVGDILAALDVFVLATPAEGFSLALAEAWLAGVPTVATRVGAVPELEERFGELVAAVPVDPSPRMLARAIQYAMSAEFRQEVVPRAQSMVTTYFTAAAMAERWTEYIHSIACRPSVNSEPSI